jgi:hypothetical protein
MTEQYQDASNAQRASRLIWRAWDPQGTPAERLARARSVARDLDAFLAGLEPVERRAVRRMAAPLRLLIERLARDVAAHPDS